MKTIGTIAQRTVRSAIAAAALFGFASASNAQQPPDVVKSDIYKNTAMGTDALHSTINNNSPGADEGIRNTAVGDGALYNNEYGADNTAVGVGALGMEQQASDNTAVGSYALSTNSYPRNTAVGAYALQHNTVGTSNTAIGVSALNSNTWTSDNTATGAFALQLNTDGVSDTAAGAGALQSNVSGSSNTASGYNALNSNTTGGSNEASGAYALAANTVGEKNTASGENALFSNTSGNSNSAFGHSALKNSTGVNNLGLGANGGYNIMGGSNNVEIANQGSASDNGIIRIGSPSTQTQTFIAGIENSKVTGAAVYVTSSGQLGVLASSERYKTSIAPMGTTTENLRQLRPVSFHLKSDPSGDVQYGLIAEEVAKVYPELVVRDAAGNVQGVRYDELAPMLLNEVQRQAAEMRELRAQLVNMQAALAEMQDKDQRVANR